MIVEVHVAESQITVSEPRRVYVVHPLEYLTEQVPTDRLWKCFLLLEVIDEGKSHHVLHDVRYLLVFAARFVKGGSF